MAYNTNNKTKSVRELMEGRTKFDVEIMGFVEGEGNVLESKRIKDFRSTEKIFYGRIDHLNRSIILKPKNLKPEKVPSCFPFGTSKRKICCLFFFFFKKRF